MTLKLRAMVVVELDAVDFADAAVKEGEIKALTAELNARYLSATYDFRERRDRESKPAPATRPRRKAKEKFVVV